MREATDGKRTLCRHSDRRRSAEEGLIFMMIQGIIN
jgi:hypothetical protein